MSEENLEAAEMPKEAWEDLLDASLTTLAEGRGISMDELESVYAIALELYKTGRYKEAATLFNFLAVFSHTERKYWMGLGAVMQAQRNFDEAIRVYSHITMLVDSTWVKPSYYAAECFLAKGDKEHAMSAIEHVRQFADTKTEEGRKYLARAEELAKLIAR